MVGYSNPPRLVITIYPLSFQISFVVMEFRRHNLICLFVRLKAGNGEDIFTCNGRWNFNNKVSMYSIFFLVYVDYHDVTCNILNSVFQRLIRASSVEKWAVVNFSARCNVRGLVRDLIKCGGMKGS